VTTGRARRDHDKSAWRDHDMSAWRDHDMSAWRDHDDQPTSRPEPPGPEAAAFYAPIGDFQGAEYRRNAFAQATAAEAAALSDRLRIGPGASVLDVGCGDARHLRWLAREAGARGVGVDVSAGLLAAAAAAVREEGCAGAVRLLRADARRLPIREGAFDAAYSVCQGGFGTHPHTDRDVLDGVVRAVRRGGRVAFTAFHALFAVRHLVPGDAFDPHRLVHHQESEVIGPDGQRRRFDLWTSSYTAREVAELASAAGLDVLHVDGCEPGRYGDEGLALDDPELLVVGVRR
jgi:SAM-dependent methyltransferase